MGKHVVKNNTVIGTVNVTAGRYRNADFTGVYTLVEGYKTHMRPGKEGGYVVVADGNQKRRVTVAGVGVGYNATIVDSKNVMTVDEAIATGKWSNRAALRKYLGRNDGVGTKDAKGHWALVDMDRVAG